MRVASLVCGLIYLSFGWIWTYWLALAVLPFGIIGLYFSTRAARENQQNGLQRTRSERTLGSVARWTNITAFAVSFSALFVTLAYN